MPVMPTGDCPPDLVEAVKRMTSYLYENREGSAGDIPPGVVSLCRLSAGHRSKKEPAPMKLDNLKAVISLLATQANAKDNATPQIDIVEKFEFDFSDGTGADQAQVVFEDTRTLAGSTNESLDLAGGLPHDLGGSITFTAAKILIVKAAATNTGNLRVGAAVSNAFQGWFGASAVGVPRPAGRIASFLIDPSATGRGRRRRDRRPPPHREPLRRARAVTRSTSPAKVRSPNHGGRGSPS
jgi:hypothetical protein